MVGCYGPSLEFYLLHTLFSYILGLSHYESHKWNSSILSIMPESLHMFKIHLHMCFFLGKYIYIFFFVPFPTRCLWETASPGHPKGTLRLRKCSESWMALMSLWDWIPDGPAHLGWFTSKLFIFTHTGPAPCSSLAEYYKVTIFLHLLQLFLTLPSCLPKNFQVHVT